MINVKLDTQKKIGQIKPMHAVGQPPFAGGILKFDFCVLALNLVHGVDFEDIADLQVRVAL